MPTGNSASINLGGSINIHDLSGLVFSLSDLVNLREQLQGLLDGGLPNLQASLSVSVSGSTVQTYLNNYPAWMNQIACILEDIQGLYNYLSPIAQAAGAGN